MWWNRFFSVRKTVEPQKKTNNLTFLVEVAAKDIMVPRADIVWVPEKIKYVELKRLISCNPFSCYPLCEGSLDKVIGLVHVSSFLGLSEECVDLSKYVTPIFFVSPSMRCLDVLVTMKEKKIYKAIVVDEYGGVDGLISMHDIMCNVVAEYDEEMEFSGDGFSFIDDNTVLADGRLEIEAFEKQFGSLLMPAERGADIDTIGGFVTYKLGRVPAVGEVFTHETGVTFCVSDADVRRIKRVKINNISLLSNV